MKAIIIDDEKRARVSLRLLLQNFCPQFTEIVECKNLSEGVKTIRKEDPDIVFLDIEMPGHSGLELLDFFNENEITFSIIFTTAYNNYAIQAFKLSAIDYLLKPINPEELITAVKLFEKRIHPSEHYTALKQNLSQDKVSKIAVPVSNKIIFLDLEDIIYLKAEGSYTNILKKDGVSILVSRNLKSFQELLEDNEIFVRIHKSYIVNSQYITAVNKSDGGFLELTGNLLIPISQDRIAIILDQVRLLRR